LRGVGSDSPPTWGAGALSQRWRGGVVGGVWQPGDVGVLVVPEMEPSMDSRGGLPCVNRGGGGGGGGGGGRVGPLRAGVAMKPGVSTAMRRTMWAVTPEVRIMAAANGWGSRPTRWPQGGDVVVRGLGAGAEREGGGGLGWVGWWVVVGTGGRCVGLGGGGGWGCGGGGGGGGFGGGGGGGWVVGGVGPRGWTESLGRGSRVRGGGWDRLGIWSPPRGVSSGR